ncbi:DUF969 family protein [Granulicatella sp. zg-ZJ]|uniref:5-oxoproline transporter, DUF969 family subunit n=1 Tax=unclassified Granulicatella TaxID=2630493 RepID=UPI0013C23391|nr:MULTISPECIES: DUF969 family protein [unclassified Granulicatella]MBS4750643.1 DUF969 domain-containing protein [Carnobacteriaceae bacterium zg-ZUI78]NEW63414.1 DUF969 family protein [Granulicatella sp. zg-ZJ]NEW66773.1 DUF969 family protein [Granulicatella sp. zg-84]QMI85357.1 DUF969 domain-containing protein [Carnobacteriaceae bacterium zg-84]
MNYLPLVGIVIILLGFIFKLDTTATIIVSAIVTALVAGISLDGAITALGENFVKSRLVTILILPVPVIALVEKYGLKEQASQIIKKMKKLTAPIFLFVYFIIRQITAATSIPFGGHAQVVRPIVYPMAEAAAAKDGELTEEISEQMKAKSAAVENIGNFYAQNVMLGSAGVLLISKTLEELGYKAPTNDIAQTALIIAFASSAVMLCTTWLWQKALKKGGK